MKFIDKNNLIKTTFLKTAYKEPSEENIENLIEYLKSLGGKQLSITCLRENCFKVKWKKKDERLRIRCHFQCAAHYLNKLKKSNSIEGFKILIEDIAPFILEFDKNEDLSFLALEFTVNTQPSAIYFDHIKNLFYHQEIKKQNQNNYINDLLVVYGLRLALENRIKRLLGYDYHQGNSNKFGLKELICISKELANIKYNKNINWNEIINVNEWLNHHIHRLLRPYPWILHQAFEVLSPLIDPKQSLKVEDKTILSLYSSAIVEDEESLQKEIEEKIKNKRGEQVKIIWTDREILKLK